MNAPRRAFLCQLARLPLIGGGVTLIGQPTAVAEPVTPDLLEAYKTFLHYESRCLAWEMADDPACLARYRIDGRDRVARSKAIDRWISHVDVGNAANVSLDSTTFDRAAVVLSAAGVDWRN